MKKSIQGGKEAHVESLLSSQQFPSPLCPCEDLLSERHSKVAESNIISSRVDINLIIDNSNVNLTI